MGYAAKWKVLEDLYIKLRKNGFDTPASVVDDLRSAKIMIILACSSDCDDDATMKLMEILGGIESELIAEASAVFSPKEIDEWLKRLEEASITTCEPELGQAKDKLITGIPRDQKWVRVEPSGNLTAEKIKQMATENQLLIKPQKDNRILVYGQQDALKEFLKKVTAEAAKK